MSIDRLRAHWAFTRMPFSKDLARNYSGLIARCVGVRHGPRAVW